MKNLKKITLAFLFTCICQFVIGQPPYISNKEKETVNTGPPPPDTYCPQNTIPGSTFGDWDWTQETFTLYIKADAGGYYTENAISPFHSNNLSLQPNTSHLVFVNGDKDYQVEDGWELLYRNFGTMDNPVAEPSYALYNRYNGLVRIFIWLTANESTSYQSAMVTTSHLVDGDLGSFSSIFEHMNSPMHALESFEKGLGYQTHNDYYEAVGTWILSEFVAAYDPCTCDYPSAISVKPILASVSDINLDITGTSITSFIMSNGTVTSPNTFGFSSAIGAAANGVNSLSAITKKGAETYKNLEKFSDFALNKIVPVATYNMNSLPANLPNWFSAVPYVGTAISVLDMLIGGGKKAAAPTVTGHSTQYQFTATGELTTSSPYQPTAFYTPGSSTEGFPTANIPNYNNALGVANLLEDPVVKMEQWGYSYADQAGDYEEYRLYKVQLKEQIQYVINEAAGISGTPNTVLGALYFRNCPTATTGPSAVTGDISPNGLIVVSPGVWRSPILPLDCLLDYTVEFNYEFVSDGYLYDDYCRGDISLKVMMVLEREPADPDANDIMYMATYVTDVEQIGLDNPQDFTIPNNPFSGSPIDLELNTDALTCADVLPATKLQVGSFCSNTYDPVALLEKEKSELRSASNSSSNKTYQIKIFPNPTSDYLEVTNMEEETVISIADMLGREWKRVVSADWQTTIDISDLASGIYSVSIFNQDGKLIEASLVTKQ